MTDGGVAGGHVVEAVAHDRWTTRVAAGSAVGHGAAGDQPHHQLDALRPRFAHVVDVRLVGQRDRIGDQVVEEGRVEVAVDEAGAGPLQLVAHAAGAPDLDVERLVVRLDGTADRAAQGEAAPAGRDRVLDDVHRERDHPARPRVGLAEHQREWDGEPVVDVEPVHEGQVEVVEDDALGDVRGELGVADDVGDRPRSPSLVGDAVPARRADGERRDDVQAEGGGVVVVDEEHHVRRVLAHPVARRLVAGEQWLPVRLAGPPLVDGDADRRHVGAVDARRERCHQRRSAHSST